MSIQVLKPPMSSGQSFGQSLSQGLEKNFGENVRQGSVAGGLKSLSGQLGSLSPLEMQSKLMSIPGIDAQTISAVAPLLQQQQVRQVRKILSEQPQQGAQPQGEMSSETGVGSHDFFGAKTPIDELSNLAEKAASEHGVNVDLALDHLKTKDADRVEREIENLSQFREGVQEMLNKETNQGIKDQLGSVVKYMAENKLKDLAQKKALTRGDIDNLVQEAYDFAKDRNNLNNIGRLPITTVVNRKNTLAKFDAIRKGYEQWGQRGLEQYRDDLISYNKLSAPIASKIAFPISSSISSTLSEIKKGVRVFGRSTPDNISEKIAKNITTSDSLLAIALELYEKGYSGSKFLNYMKDQNITDSQRSEISMIPRGINQFLKNFGDHLLFATMGKGTVI